MNIKNLILLTSLLLFGCATTEFEEPKMEGLGKAALFDLNQWGKANILTKQHAASATLESIVSGQANFERINRYDEGGVLRKIAKSVGRLDVHSKDDTFRTCTATIVSRRLILTNQHCIDGRLEKVELLLGYYDDSDTSETERIVMNPIPISEDAEIDYAVLEANVDIPSHWEVAKLSDGILRQNESLVFVHHPFGSVMHVTRGRCQAKSANPVMPYDALHFCDSLSGSSGGPMFGENQEVVAIHIGGTTSLGVNRANHSAQIFGIAQASLEIRELIEAHEEAETRSGRIAYIDELSADTLLELYLEKISTEISPRKTSYISENQRNCENLAAEGGRDISVCSKIKFGMYLDALKDTEWHLSYLKDKCEAGYPSACAYRSRHFGHQYSDRLDYNNRSDSISASGARWPSESDARWPTEMLPER